MKKLYTSYRFKLYPNSAESILLKKHFEATRFVYNIFKDINEAHKNFTGKYLNFNRMGVMLTHLKQLDQYYWLNDVSVQCLQQALKDLNKAYSNYFEGRCNPPKYKSKKQYHNSFRTSSSIKLLPNNRLQVLKFPSGIKIKQHREIIGTIKNATIKLNPSGKYYVSLLVEYDSQVPTKPKVEHSSTTGVDLGIKTYATLSNKLSYTYPLYLERNLDKLKELHAKFSKSKSKRVRLDIAKLHEKIANQRLDFLHKLTKELVTTYDSIAIEDLDIKDMLKSHSSLARRILDCSWYTFRQLLTYKAELYGCNLIVIPKYYPSSKSCSNCGCINNNLKLTDREYICPNCGLTLDRDLNAAINIFNKGLEQAR